MCRAKLIGLHLQTVQQRDERGLKNAREKSKATAGLDMARLKPFTPVAIDLNKTPQRHCTPTHVMFNASHFYLKLEFIDLYIR